MGVIKDDTEIHYADSIDAREGKLQMKLYAKTSDQHGIVGQFPSHNRGGPNLTVGPIWALMMQCSLKLLNQFKYNINNTLVVVCT